MWTLTQKQIVAVLRTFILALIIHTLMQTFRTHSIAPITSEMPFNFYNYETKKLNHAIGHDFHGGFCFSPKKSGENKLKMQD